MKEAGKPLYLARCRGKSEQGVGDSVNKMAIQYIVKLLERLKGDYVLDSESTLS